MSPYKNSLYRAIDYERVYGVVVVDVHRIADMD